MNQKKNLELLDDGQILAMCNQSMSENDQERLSELLVKQREELLTNVEKNQLDQVMHVYRKGLLNKTKALQIAVERDLINRISSECYQYQSEIFRDLLNPLEPASPDFEPDEAKWSYLKEKFNLDTLDMLTIFERISQNAQGQGLTEEILEELLADEF